MKNKIMIHTTARLRWESKEEMEYFLLNYWGMYRNYLYLFNPKMRIKEILTIFWSKTTSKYRNIFWRNPGYAMGVDECGELIYHADFGSITNGAAGHNSDSVHLYWDGGIELKDGKFIEIDNRTEDQKAGLYDAIKMALDWNIKYNDNKINQIIGHHDVNPYKACPIFNAKDEYSWIMA